MPRKAPLVDCADTLEQAAAILKVPIESLKEAKASGCRAFRHGRVFIAEYREWIKTSPPAPIQTDGNGTKISWEIARIKKQCRKWDLEFEKDQGMVIDKNVLKEELAKLMAPVLSILSASLKLEEYNECVRKLQAGVRKLVS